MVWEYLEVANFILGLAIFGLTVGILVMLRKTDEVLLKAKLFLGEGRGFIYITGYYLLGIVILIALHSLAWLASTKDVSGAYFIYCITKTLYLGLICMLLTQWFIVAKDCLKSE